MNGFVSKTQKRRQSDSAADFARGRRRDLRKKLRAKGIFASECRELGSK
jgi:hypothetical protein